MPAPGETAGTFNIEVRPFHRFRSDQFSRHQKQAKQKIHMHKSTYLRSCNFICLIRAAPIPWTLISQVLHQLSASTLHPRARCHVNLVFDAQNHWCNSAYSTTQKSLSRMTCPTRTWTVMLMKFTNISKPDQNDWFEVRPLKMFPPLKRLQIVSKFSNKYSVLLGYREFPNPDILHSTF